MEEIDLNSIYQLYQSNDQLLYLKAIINDQSYEFCIDSGAAVSILGKDFIPLLSQLEVRPFPSLLRTATSAPIEVFGKVILPDTIQDRTYFHEFILASTPKNFLGADFLHKYNMWLNISQGLLTDNDPQEFPTISAEIESFHSINDSVSIIAESSISEKSFSELSSLFPTTSHTVEVNHISDIHSNTECSSTTSSNEAVHSSLDEFPIVNSSNSIIFQPNETTITDHDSAHMSVETDTSFSIINTVAIVHDIVNDNQVYPTFVSSYDQSDTMIPLPLASHCEEQDSNCMVPLGCDRDHGGNSIDYDGNTNHGSITVTHTQETFGNPYRIFLEALRVTEREKSITEYPILLEDDHDLDSHHQSIQSDSTSSILHSNSNSNSNSTLSLYVNASSNESEITNESSTDTVIPLYLFGIESDSGLDSSDEYYTDIDVPICSKELHVPQDAICIDDTYRETVMNHFSTIYPQVFSGEINLNVRHDITLKIELTAPFHRPYIYQVPYVYRKAVKSRIDEMLERGIIRQSSSEFANPITCALKKDGSVRVCGDFRALNAVTRTDCFSLPRIDFIKRNIRGRIFSTLDLKDGFFQIPMHEESIPKTAIYTEWGLFEYVRMPFGLKNAPPTFQRLVNMVFHGLDDIMYVYIDDVIIFSNTLEEHVQHLNTVLERMDRYGLVTQQKKCNFFVSKIQYLGLEFDEHGYRPLPKLIPKIEGYPSPKTRRDVQKFLGLINYYRTHVPKFGRHCTSIVWSTQEIDQIYLDR